ncbi:hypothetical protein GOM44_00770 [Wolbachia endosymbiont of Atemnus politus]|uniref:hypothetical protein n=1 Tax=Wolbachia endosymbiont of Atemnus politus TaxID=2682840 RepID=UPI001571C1AF|nr:hypothetical protein [Wolbachia endosymbiont of Atemnus politus]NSX83057.1 hypothetical protein [Wolbachia endosymbiont of Atemnus politus]
MPLIALSTLMVLTLESHSLYNGVIQVADTGKRVSFQRFDTGIQLVNKSREKMQFFVEIAQLDPSVKHWDDIIGALE